MSEEPSEWVEMYGGPIDGRRLSLKESMLSVIYATFDGIALYKRERGEKMARFVKFTPSSWWEPKPNITIIDDIDDSTGA